MQVEEPGMTAIDPERVARILIICSSEEDNLQKALFEEEEIRSSLSMVSEDLHVELFRGHALFRKPNACGGAEAPIPQTPAHGGKFWPAVVNLVK